MNLTQTQKNVLRDLIVNEPYASMTPADCAQFINQEKKTVSGSRLINERTVLAEWSDPVAAETFLQTLEGVATQNAVVARAMRWMKPSEDGIDCGHPNTQAMVQQLVTLGAIQQSDADKFFQMADTEVDLTNHLGLPKLYVGDIEEARI